MMLLGDRVIVNKCWKTQPKLLTFKGDPFTIYLLSIYTMIFLKYTQLFNIEKIFLGVTYCKKIQKYDFIVLLLMNNDEVW